MAFRRSDEKEEKAVNGGPLFPEASEPSVSLQVPNGYYALLGDGKIGEYLAGLPR